jgi:predicted ferric reductase
VGLGQTGFYIWSIVALTFYIRPAIGQKTWRLIHYSSFFMYLLGLFHGIFSGTDTSMIWAQKYYWFSAGSLLFLFVARVIGSLIDKLFPAKKAVPSPKPTQG